MRYFGVYLVTKFPDGKVHKTEAAPNKPHDDKQRTIWHVEKYIKQNLKRNKKQGIEQTVEVDSND